MAAMMSAPELTRAQSGSDMQVKRDIEYAAVGLRSLKLDLYIPQGVAKPMPVVMWVHGGGWREGSKDIPMMLPLAPLGFAVASIDYRLSQEAIFPAQIYDCKAAVRWLRYHGPEYGLDPKRIAAAGASAGGHLVALLGTTANESALEGMEGYSGVSSAVQAVVDFYGPTDFTDLGRDYTASQTNFVAELLGGSIDRNWEKARAASPVFHVDARSCPFYIAHGDHDSIVPVEQSIELDAALTKAGVPSALYIAKGRGHGFSDATSMAGVIDFLRQYLQISPR
jgi:acetyl esterase/lipase